MKFVFALYVYLFCPIMQSLSLLVYVSFQVCRSDFHLCVCLRAYVCECVSERACVCVCVCVTVCV